MTPEVLQELIAAKTRLARIEAEAAQRLDDERQKSIRALAEKGEIEAAFEELRKDHAARLLVEQEKAARLEEQILTDRKEVAVTQALAGTAFADKEAAAAARALVALGLESVRDPATGQVVVREKATGRPAAEYVAAWLASSVAARLLAPTTRGGAPFAGSPPVPTPNGSAAGRQARNLGEAALTRWRQAQRENPAGPPGLAGRRA